MANVVFLHQIRLSWAGPAAATHYGASGLSVADMRRAARPRSPKAQADWQVSRALLHACREPGVAVSAESLSHSQAHALLAQAPCGWRVGADIEKIQPRRVLALAEWACSASEIAWLQNQPQDDARLQCFYMLWTLKEAFIKACGLSFPADLCRYGLDAGPDASLSLRAPVGAWQARLYLIGTNWMASTVWLPAEHDSSFPEPLWCAGPASVLPPVRLLGAWPPLQPF